MEGSGRPVVIVEGVAVKVWPWSSWRDAVTARDPATAAALRRGDCWLADGRGQPLDPGGSIVDGARLSIRRSDDGSGAPPGEEPRVPLRTL